MRGQRKLSNIGQKGENQRPDRAQEWRRCFLGRKPFEEGFLNGQESTANDWNQIWVWRAKIRGQDTYEFLARGDVAGGKWRFLGVK